jgi:hypothetical protein
MNAPPDRRRPPDGGPRFQRRTALLTGEPLPRNQSRGPVLLDQLIILGMLGWLAWSVIGRIFPFATGWRRPVVVLASAWVGLALAEAAGKLHQRWRARRGLAPPPQWPRPAAWAPLVLALAAVLWLGVIPSVRIPRALARPREWPATADAGYRARLITWRSGGSVHYRAVADCARGICVPLRGIRTDLAAAGHGASDFCEGAELRASRRQTWCEGELGIEAVDYHRASQGIVTLYLVHPVQPPAP